jgi:cob(I)alamin adenosyltransferase
MKIYTKTGDDGTTGLIGGDRVRKYDPRIECYGTIDELNAGLGWAAVVADAGLTAMLRDVQNDLFVIGSHLATPAEGRHAENLPALDDGMIDRLEMQIDSAESGLPMLREFILPGGGETAARLHYVNRLSDWLFVQARAANARAGVADVPWVKP